MSSRLSAAKAKAQLSECIRKAENGESVIITRHGRPVAALVGGDRIAEVTGQRSRGGAAGLASLAGGWEGSAELVKALRTLHRTAPRIAELDE